MTIDVAKIERQFWRFSASGLIPSKDEGLIPFTPFNTQTYLIHEILTGVAEGIHNFVVVKPRQVGATTAFLFFDAYWMLKWGGLTGQFVADSDSNKEVFRALLSDTVKTLPTKYHRAERKNNRVQMSWVHGSRFLFQTAGKRFAKRVGRSRGLNFLHGTEVAYWEDADSVSALQNALSEKHPLAVYIWESTANGYNFFYDMYTDGLRALTTKVIFVPWWRHELYEVHEDSADEKQRQIYKVYWDGHLSADEAAWQREITRRWGVTLRPGQWAWWRWKLAERVGEITQMHEDFPTLPEHAFQASGSEFVGHTVMGRLRDEIVAAPEPEFYRYTFGPLIEETGVYTTEEPLAHLRVWQPPDPLNYYVVSADPAFGASEKSDRSVCQVWYATRQGLFQVAEFVSTEVTMQQFAWVTMHLAGTYTPSAFILELNGPGYGVLQEIERLRAWGWGTARHGELQNALQGIQHYLYRRSDSLSSGAFLQWKSTAALKEWSYSRLRDYLITGLVHPTSTGFLEELGTIRQDGSSFNAAGKAHDDRISTAAMAVEVWQSQVVPILQIMPPRGPKPDQQPEKAAPAHERLTRAFFESIGAKGPMVVR